MAAPTATGSTSSSPILSDIYADDVPDDEAQGSVIEAEGAALEAALRKKLVADKAAAFPQLLPLLL